MNPLIIIAITISFPAGLIIGGALILKNYDKARLICSDIISFFGFTHKSIRKNRIKWNIEGHLNLFAKKINKDFADLLLPNVKVEFVNEQNIDKFLESGRPIIRMPFKRNNTENLVNAAVSYVSVACIPDSRQYLKEEIIRAIDLNLTRQIFIDEKNNEAVKYFDNNFLIPATESIAQLSKYFEQVKDIEKSGFLGAILLKEYQDFGPKLYPEVASVTHRVESDKFFTFIHNLSVRQKDERVELKFYDRTIRIGVILVSKTETYDNWGVAAYIRRMKLLSQSGINTFYLFSRGEKQQAIMREIRDELGRNSHFQQLLFKKTIQGDTTVVYALYKLDYESLVADTIKLVKEVEAKNTPIDVIVTKVTHDHLEVDLNGVSASIAAEELSSGGLINPIKYFQENDELTVKVINSTNPDDIKLSNKGTDTDPIERIKKQYSSDKIFTATISEIKENGLFIKLDDEAFALVPFFRAVFGKFQKLESLYKVGQKIQVSVYKIDAKTKHLFCMVPGRIDPWLSINKYSEGQIVDVRVGGIDGRKVDCEIEAGIEGLVWSNNLDWSEKTVAQLGIKLEDRFKAKIKRIDLEKRLVYLSKKDITINPTQDFFETNKEKLVSGKVSGIDSRTVELEFANQVKGLVHISEWDWRFVEDLTKTAKLNEQVQVVLLGLNIDHNVVRASRKQASPNPMEELKRNISLGEVVRGRVKTVYDWGAEINLLEKQGSFEAIVHKSELTNLFYVNKSSQLLNVNDEGMFVVKDLDLPQKRILLSRKRHFVDAMKKFKFQYGEPYLMKRIGETNSGQQVLVHDDNFEGLMLETPAQAKGYKRGEKVEVLISRMIPNKGYVEVYLPPKS